MVLEECGKNKTSDYRVRQPDPAMKPKPAGSRRVARSWQPGDLDCGTGGKLNQVLINEGDSQNLKMVDNQGRPGTAQKGGKEEHLPRATVAD
jgi:hypothetical protein